jgi:hypothetical protein
MSYTVTMRRNLDNLVRKITYPYEYSDFLWTSGNWSCDCNRERDFFRAADDTLPERTDNLCLGHGKYTVLEIETDDGSVFYPDGLEETP